MKNVQVLKQWRTCWKKVSVFMVIVKIFYFLAKDVAAWINHSNPNKMISDSDLSDDEMIKLRIGTLTNSYSTLFPSEQSLAGHFRRVGESQIEPLFSPISLP
ncbi:MAG: Bro-N domain-containing protein [Dysgonamonadaceae bacterium]|jgi:prophage antirepressor-like protein|nr:Bro-N domain-containing protein [Dysgonamonadaceae bacterium]